MSLPFTRSTTYLDGGPPAITAADLNDLQDYLARSWSTLRGAWFSYLDHFAKSVVDSTAWVVANTGSATVATIDDSANGANGALSLATSAASSNASIKSYGGVGPLGFKGDFWISTRLRIPATASLGSQHTVGLYATGNDGHSCFISYYQPTSHNFQFVVSPATGATTDVSYDLGVTRDTAYHTFDVVRLNGSIKVFVDGTLKQTIVNAVPFNTTAALLTTQPFGVTGSASTYVDRVALLFSE